MDIRVSRQQGRVPVTVFHVAGNIDMNSSDKLQTQVRQALDSGARYILLDLSGVPYVSSSGLRVFLDTLNLLRGDSPPDGLDVFRRGRPDADAFKSPYLKLLSPSEQVRRVMTLTGLDVFMEIHDELDKAVASF